MNNDFDVAIVGGGICGCSLFYTLSLYSDVKRIALLEKYDSLSSVSSNPKSNSQTIHDGSIETNYSLSKASNVKLSANRVKNYAISKGLQNKAIFNMQKLVIGVGDLECDFIQNRHNEFREIFPSLQFFNKSDLRNIEPNVILGINGRDRCENVVASGYLDSWCAIDFGKLSINFVEEANKNRLNNGVYLGFEVTDIKPNQNGGYTLISKDKRRIDANFVVVNAGAHSLLLAKRMGYASNLFCLPVAGSFYFVSGNILRGKVYSVQNPKLPFAALHGDPDISFNGCTRFGPTALVIPKLERSNRMFNGISYQLLKMNFKIDVVRVMFDLVSDHDIRNYVIRNMMFEIPYLGNKLFIQDARKIIPTLRVKDITYAHGFGGVRPQVIDMETRKLELGERKIATRHGILFNMTPSPGATSCLTNAYKDSIEITKYLCSNFDIDRFTKDLDLLDD